MSKEFSPPGVDRAVKSENNEVIYWKDGGVDIKIDNVWYCRWDNDEYIKADESRCRFLDGIKKEDISVKR